jgi:hypothetical protein
MSEILSPKQIEKKIFIIRDQKVMIDSDLAELYGIETRALNQAVSRNIERFPDDFMFQLTIEEANHSRSQNVILKRGQNVKYRPRVFTEQGVAMLSSVLNSARAIQINIHIMRVFTGMRKLFMENRDIFIKLEEIRKELSRFEKLENRQDVESKAIWNAISILQKELHSIKVSK